MLSTAMEADLAAERVARSCTSSCPESDGLGVGPFGVLGQQEPFGLDLSRDLGRFGPVRADSLVSAVQAGLRRRRGDRRRRARSRDRQGRPCEKHGQAEGDRR